MGMNYSRAWALAKTVKGCFRQPLIEAAKGGIGGAGRYRAADRSRLQTRVDKGLTTRSSDGNVSRRIATLL
jgi:molybdenum-dependent DNA-binding transcriptional regulator ModE